jgi:hypothetical protein
MRFLAATLRNPAPGRPRTFPPAAPSARLRNGRPTRPGWPLNAKPAASPARSNPRTEATPHARPVAVSRQGLHTRRLRANWSAGFSCPHVRQTLIEGVPPFVEGGTSRRSKPVCRRSAARGRARRRPGGRARRRGRAARPGRAPRAVARPARPRSESTTALSQCRRHDPATAPRKNAVDRRENERCGLGGIGDIRVPPSFRKRPSVEKRKRDGHDDE